MEQSYCTFINIKYFQHHHHQYLSEVMSKPADLPKYDFAKLKKQMPEHAAVLDSLQKQYETFQIPLETIPDKFMKACFSFSHIFTAHKIITYDFGMH